MSNNYFNHVTNVIAAGVRALAAQVNNIANEVAVGFDKLPTLDQFKYRTSNYATDTGAANAYVVTVPFSAAPFSLTDGMKIRFKPVATNTGASTLNVNSLGAKAIVFFNGDALGALAIYVNNACEVQYDSTNDRFVMLSQGGKVTTTIASEIAEQYTVATGTKDLDLSGATYFYPSGAMTAVAVDFTFSNPATTGLVSSFTLELNNMDANTDSTPWPVSVDWAWGVEPTWSDGKDIVRFETRDGGTTWHGFLVAQDVG